MNSGKGNQQLIAALNKALSLEYAAIVQYAQSHFMLTGQERINFSDFFLANTKEAHLHAINLGNKIVALGGVPATDLATVRQATGLREMLSNALELERTALAAYISAWEAAAGIHPLRFWLEDIIRAEQLHVEELEKLTNPAKSSEAGA